MKQALIPILATIGSLFAALVVVSTVMLAEVDHMPNTIAMRTCARELRNPTQLRSGGQFDRCFAAHGGTGTLTHYQKTVVRITPGI